MQVLWRLLPARQEIHNIHDFICLKGGIIDFLNYYSKRSVVHEIYSDEEFAVK